MNPSRLFANLPNLITLAQGNRVKKS